jgi:tRNA(fMet)-specific endonuclease VapC
VERLIVDTTVLIAAERDRRTLDVADEDDVAIAAVTAAELLVGVQLADSRRRARRAAFVDAVLAEIPIEPYDLDTARAHAALLAHTRRSGRSRGPHDLLIAATAITSGRTVITADAAGFADLPGLQLRTPA